MKGFSTLPALVCILLLNWFGAGLLAGAQPPTLDVSTDLTGLPKPYNEPVNMVPNDPNQDSASLLQDAIYFVIEWNTKLDPANPYTTITASQPGTFYFNLYTATVAHPNGTAAQLTYIFANGLSKVTIDLGGSLLMSQLSFISVFTIEQCNNCIFRNFAIDYQNLPFTQVTVQTVDSNTDTLTVAIQAPTPGQPAYLSPYLLYQNQNTPDPIQNNATIYGFDFRNGKPVYSYGRWDLQQPTLPISNVNSNIITVTDPSSDLNLIHTGDTFVVEARGGGPAIGLSSSSDVTLANISIYSTGGVGIQTKFSPSVSIQNVSIMPPPATNRLVSTNAGGIAINETAGNNSIVNCNISRTQDDSISGNANALGIVQKYSGTSLSVSVVAIPTIFPPKTNPLDGMGVTFVDPSTESVVGSATIANDAPGPPYKDTITIPLKEPINKLPPDALMFYSEADYRGNGLVIKDNSISYNTLARGIALSGETGVIITNNTLTSIQEAGIICGTGGDYGLLSNLTIANNTLNHTNLGTGVVGDTMLAAIQILTTNSYDDLILTQPNQNINITNNQITGTPRTGIWVMNVSSGVISGNVLKHTGYNPLPPLKSTIPGQFNLSGAKAVLNSRTPVVIQSSNLTVVNNSYKP
jgi:Right handed beta helix region